MKRTLTFAILLSLFLALVGRGVTWADPWAVVANDSDRTIHTIDLGTDPPTVYGPFLEGQLGLSGNLLDVGVTPDGQYALVGNRGLKTVYRIDLLDPINPVLAGSVEIGFPVGDIAIAPNGHFALVVDGVGFNRMAIIDLIDFSLTTTYTLKSVSAGAGAVAIAPDNQTVIICDYFFQRIIYGVLDPTTGLIFEKTLPTGGYPINVAISPDGQTALAIGWYTFGSDKISVFRITGPGVVEPGVNPTLSALPVDHQSIAFSPDGQEAYVVSYYFHPDRFSWLQIKGPGDVILGGARVTTLLTDVLSGLYGVDVLAITPDGSHALVGNPSNFVPNPKRDLSRNVAMVDLSDWSLTEIPIDSSFPVGIAVFNQIQSTLDPVVDIKPGSCLNPLNVKSKGVLPVAILGTEEFNVTAIDVRSIVLSREGNWEGVEPIPFRWSYEDIATPFGGESCGCHELGSDGHMDLTLKFRTQEVVETIGAVTDGQEVVLTITGDLVNQNTGFEGSDSVRILKKGIKILDDGGNRKGKLISPLSVTEPKRGGMAPGKRRAFGAEYR
jgi:DNA-binding beta-propeller fold protein YncE